MNQIIFFKNDNQDENSNQDKINSSRKKNKKKIIKFQFIISFITLLVSISSGIYLYQKNAKSPIDNKNLISNYNIRQLYNADNSKNNVTTYTINGKEFSILGFLEIPKLNIKYPILSEYTDELLKISPCKFFRTKY